MGVFIFMKMLLFNMLLQPHKFDDQAFPKGKEPVSTNLKVIGSVYYHLVKNVIEEFISMERNEEIYKVGNWLKVEK